jgi:hypothetical protein
MVSAFNGMHYAVETAFAATGQNSDRDQQNNNHHGNNPEPPH